MKHYRGFGQPNCLMVSLAACTEEEKFLQHVLDTTNAGYHQVADWYGFEILAIVGSPFAGCGATFGQLLSCIEYCRGIPLIAHLKPSHAVALYIDSEFVFVYDSKEMLCKQHWIADYPWGEIFFLETVLPKGHEWLEVRNYGR